jgi:hypothetical protein
MAWIFLGFELSSTGMRTFLPRRQMNSESQSDILRVVENFERELTLS